MSASVSSASRVEDLDRIRITGELTFRALLSPEAQRFLISLHTRFEPVRRQLLARRVEVQKQLDAGQFPEFLPETRSIREGSWKAAPIPEEIRDRRVEITGPVDRKMVINALNSGARVFMADFEDSHAPTWKGTLEGQLNMIDAVRRTISFTSPEGKKYALNPSPAVLMVRPRGWHLTEKHVLIDGARISGSLFDFGLFFFHNAKELIARGSRPYFYLPKMENHREARLWNDVFNFAQDELAIPRGTIRATVLIETILAVFEMDEIIHELKDHSAGLNCGRWDYIFSYIKKFRKHPEFLLPDRAAVTMTSPFLSAYVDLLIRTCHKRGVHAMGGMAAQIPIKNDPAANTAAMDKVKADKLREARAGHDGTWVAHPGLVPLAREIFDAEMPGPNQVERTSADRAIAVRELLVAPEGEITEAGLRRNVSVALAYLSAWLDGLGCVPLHHLMEDAATAEISRAQIWQWIRHPGGVLADGRRVTVSLFRSMLEDELAKAKAAPNASANLAPAAKLLEQITTAENFEEFLTLPAYEQLD